MFKKIKNVLIFVTVSFVLFGNIDWRKLSELEHNCTLIIKNY